MQMSNQRSFLYQKNVFHHTHSLAFCYNLLCLCLFLIHTHLTGAEYDAVLILVLQIFGIVQFLSADTQRHRPQFLISTEVVPVLCIEREREREKMIRHRTQKARLILFIKKTVPQGIIHKVKLKRGKE